MSSAHGMGVMVGKSDEQFITKAAQGGMMEVEVGRLAQEKGSTNEVKEFGRKLEQDHTKANEQLKQLAASKNVHSRRTWARKRLPWTRFARLSGDQFEKAFLKMAVKRSQERRKRIPKGNHSRDGLRRKELCDRQHCRRFRNTCGRRNNCKAACADARRAASDVCIARPARLPMPAAKPQQAAAAD